MRESGRYPPFFFTFAHILHYPGHHRLEVELAVFVFPDPTDNFLYYSLPKQGDPSEGQWIFEGFSWNPAQSPNGHVRACRSQELSEPRH